VGVSNHNLAEIKQADAILREHGLRLGAVQNHYSLINRSSEDSGILDWCRENDVVFFSYMVLEQGALSGKYDTTHPMPEGSARAATYNPGYRTKRVAGPPSFPQVSPPISPD
jgi:aryl-alcohol dehydrogenase-like predicted oxidoreductase